MIIVKRLALLCFSRVSVVKELEILDGLTWDLKILAHDIRSKGEGISEENWCFRAKGNISRRYLTNKNGVFHLICKENGEDLLFRIIVTHMYCCFMSPAKYNRWTVGLLGKKMC